VDYFKQFEAEKVVTRFNRNTGVPKKVWVQKSGAKNEVFDLWGYAYAALARLIRRKGLDLELAAKRIQKMREPKPARPNPPPAQPYGAPPGMVRVDNPWM
jgi:phage terminase large subunit GpA-like protein